MTECWLGLTEDEHELEVDSCSILNSSNSFHKFDLVDVVHEHHEADLA